MRAIHRMATGVAGMLLLALMAVAGAARAASATDIVIRDFVITTRIAENEPVDAVEDIPAANGQAFAFARFDNPGEPTPVIFVWFRDGTEVRRAEQTIGKSAGWRSYTSSRIRAGKWRVELRQGPLVLAEREFLVR